MKSGKVSGDLVRDVSSDTVIRECLTVGVSEPSEYEDASGESEDHLDTGREAAGSSLKCLARLL
jgi:hypothetical protein